MSLLDYGTELDEDLSLQVFTDGEEVQFMIKEATLHTSATSGNQSIKVVLESVQYPDTHDDVVNYVGLPSDTASVKDRKKALGRLKDFYLAFDVDTSQPVSIESDLPGKTGVAIVGVDTYEGNTKNTIKKFQVFQ